jgi:hypothetical protein
MISERALPQETPPNVPPFGNLRLDQVRLEETAGNGGELQGSQDVVIGGATFRVGIVDRRSRREDGSAAETLLIRLERGGSRVSAVVEVSYPRRPDGAAKSQVEIVKNDPAGEIPRETGVELYEKILDLIADLAVQRGVPIIDNVRRNPAHLLPETWHRLFDDLLAERGYARLDDETWQKKYVPPEPSSKP